MDAFNEKTLFNGNGESLKKQDQSHPALVHPGILQTTIIHKQERPDNHDHRDHKKNKNKIDDDVLTGSNHYHHDHDNKNKNIDDVLRDHLGSEGRKTLRTARFSSGSLQWVGFSRSFIALKLLQKE